MRVYLIWDADGTLFDTYPVLAGCLQQALEAMGKTESRDVIQQLAQVTMDHCYAVLAEKHDVDAEELRERARANYRQVPPAGQMPFPGVVDLCKRVCADGGQNFIVTHRDRDSLAALLETHGMAGLFAACITRDDEYPRKPDPAAFLALIERYSLPRESVWAVGDRDLDVLAGQAAGVKTCLFGGADAAADVGVEPDCRAASYQAFEAVLFPGVL
ncbi:MAG: HAD-IA family hydrolase [Anaerolineae bacterium]|nr:HAD-IA family hydrolase [Anaerolineae bacterium]